MEALRTAPFDPSEPEAALKTGPVILVVGQDRGLGQSLPELLNQEGYLVLQSRLETVADRIREGNPSLVLYSPDGASAGPLEPLKTIQNLRPDLPVLVVTGASQRVLGVAALEGGAVDCISQPFEATELLARVKVQLRTAARLKQLSTLAHVDELTGVYNRRGLMTQLQQVMARSVREGRPFSLLMLDLDDFKQINDRLGHHVGDRVLRQAAHALSSVVREADVVARLGGDEFVVLLTQCEYEKALRVVDRIEQALKTPASIGVVSPSLDGGDVEALLRDADRAMYEAKRRRKLRGPKLAANF